MTWSSEDRIDTFCLGWDTAELVHDSGKRNLDVRDLLDLHLAENIPERLAWQAGHDNAIANCIQYRRYRYCSVLDNDAHGICLLRSLDAVLYVHVA
jgi:hypothetical protein